MGCYEIWDLSTNQCQLEVVSSELRHLQRDPPSWQLTSEMGTPPEVGGGGMGLTAGMAIVAKFNVSSTSTCT